VQETETAKLKSHQEQKDQRILAQERDHTTAMLVIQERTSQEYQALFTRLIEEKRQLEDRTAAQRQQE
jgi:hypothetical protein